MKEEAKTKKDEIASFLEDDDIEGLVDMFKDLDDSEVK